MRQVGQNPPKAIVDKALVNGVVLNAAGNNTIRFVSPFVINNVVVGNKISILVDSINAYSWVLITK